MKIANQRSLFELPEGITYLNCAFMSPLLRNVRLAGEGGMRRRAKPWEVVPKDFFEECETVRRLFATLIGGDLDGVAIAPSASYGLAVAAANLKLAPGKGVLILDQQFPSNVLVWKEKAKLAGGQVVTVTRPKGEDWTKAVLSKLDSNIGIVAVPNCHWCDGTLLDLMAVRKRTWELGIPLVLDVSQSLSVYPLNVATIQPDFLISVGYKWLMGPYGSSFLYAAPKHREGTPIEFNWLNRAGSEKFSALGTYPEEYHRGARRYDMGERSNPLLLPMVSAALRQILSWGVENLQQTIGELTSIVEEELSATPANLRGAHMIGVDIGDGRKCLSIAQTLAKEGIFVSARGNSLRIAPHVYNTRDEVFRCVKRVKELM